MILKSHFCELLIIAHLSVIRVNNNRMRVCFTAAMLNIVQDSALLESVGAQAEVV